MDVFSLGVFHLYKHIHRHFFVYFLGTPLIASCLSSLPEACLRIDSAQPLKARHWSLGIRTLTDVGVEPLGVGNVSHDARGSTCGRHYVSRMVCTNTCPEIDMIP